MVTGNDYLYPFWLSLSRCGADMPRTHPPRLLQAETVAMLHNDLKPIGWGEECRLSGGRGKFASLYLPPEGGGEAPCNLAASTVGSGVFW
jgi:hypothetical protein